MATPGWSPWPAAPGRSWRHWRSFRIGAAAQLQGLLRFYSWGTPSSPSNYNNFQGHSNVCETNSPCSPPPHQPSDGPRDSAACVQSTDLAHTLSPKLCFRTKHIRAARTGGSADVAMRPVPAWGSLPSVHPRPVLAIVYCWIPDHGEKPRAFDFRRETRYR